MLVTMKHPDGRELETQCPPHRLVSLKATHERAGWDVVSESAEPGERDAEKLRKLVELLPKIRDVARS